MPAGQIKIAIPDGAFGESYAASNTSYEPHLTAYLFPTLGDGKVFIDIGANVGIHSLLSALVVGNSGKVISVEPDRRNTECLYKSKLLNNFSQLQIWPVAASEELRPEALLEDDASNSGVRGLDHVTESVYAIVQGVPIDLILQYERRVDVIKIDIEGREYPAMRGAVKTLMRHRPIVFSEFTPDAMPGVSGCAPEEFLQFMFGLGYSASVVNIDGSGIVHCEQDVKRVMQEVESDILRSRGMRHLDILFKHNSIH